jgi:hypothetical protein
MVQMQEALKVAHIWDLLVQRPSLRQLEQVLR